MAPQLGLTFDGVIREFPSIKVDNFTPDNNFCSTELFLLSHVHSDHLTGLTGKTKFSLKVPIITNNATKALLRSIPSISDSVLQAISVHPANKRIKFQLKEETIYITMIPSYHCIGSVMFLIETGNQEKSCLYTGDLRAEEFFVTSLKYNMHLLPYIKELKIPSRRPLTLESIYLDTTFAYRYSNISMLSNMQGIHQLGEMMELYPSGTKFVFPDLVSGFEEVWLYLGEKFGKESLIFNSYIKKRIMILEKELNDKNNDNKDTSSSQISPYFSIQSLFDLISCTPENREPISKFVIYIGYPDELVKDIRVSHVLLKPTINVTSGCFTRLGVIKLDSSGTIPNDLVSVGNSNDIEEDLFENVSTSKLFIKVKGKNLLLPMTLCYYFSRHSSCMETMSFVSKFRVNEVYGIVESEETWKRGFNMKRYYGNLCESNTFKFDIEREKIYGPKMFEENSVEILDNLNFSATEELLSSIHTNKNNAKQTFAQSVSDGFGNNLVFKGLDWKRNPRSSESATKNKQYIYNKLFVTKQYNGKLSSPFLRESKREEFENVSNSPDLDNSQEEMMARVQQRLMSGNNSQIRSISFESKGSSRLSDKNSNSESKCPSYDFSFQTRVTILSSYDESFKNSLEDKHPVHIDYKFIKFKKCKFRNKRVLIPKKRSRQRDEFH